MFYLNREVELTPDLLYKMINKFRVEVEPQLNKRKNYYDGIQKILTKHYADETKPCSRTVVNYAKNICDSYAGYMATPGYISYSSEQDIEDIMDILRYNDYQTEDVDLLLDALIYGVASELMYIDKSGHTRFSIINPCSCFGVFDDSLTADLLYFVRFYQASEWDDSNRYFVDVYSDTTIKHYEMAGDLGSLRLLSEEPHFFSQCPANIFTLPDEQGIFDCIMTLQDAVNELLSSEIDDFSAFCDAYLVLTNVDAERDDILRMKEDRVILLPADASASWLTKNSVDTQVENMLKRIHDSIYRIASCVDFSSESFTGGVSSGVAIRFKLSGMETRAGIIEGRMRKALQRRIEIICGIASLKLGEEVFRDVQVNFKRNIPDDTAATINLINGLKGSVSDETLLGLLPFIDNPADEVEKVQSQKQANLELYDFGHMTGSDGEDE